MSEKVQNETTIARTLEIKMKRALFWVFVLILLCFQSTVSFSQTKKVRTMISAPQFFTLGKANSNDVLKMECEGQEPLFSNIDCTFTHAIIFKKTEAELAEERKKRQLDASKMTDKDINPTTIPGL
jgi:thiamine kinase-like enzyme